MWGLDYKESWMPKNWCFWTVVLEKTLFLFSFFLCLEKTLESHLDRKEIQPVNPERSQSWIFIGSTDAEAETPILWPPDSKNWLIGKDPDAQKDWGWEKGVTEDEMVGWHHWLNGHEFEQAPGVGDGLGSLASCSPWGRKESDTTEWLNWTERKERKVKSLSSVQLFGTPWTIAYQVPPSKRFSRQEYLSTFPSLGDLLDPGIEPGSPALKADALLSEHQGSWTELIVIYELQQST